MQSQVLKMISGMPFIFFKFSKVFKDYCHQLTFFNKSICVKKIIISIDSLKRMKFESLRIKCPLLGLTYEINEIAKKKNNLAALLSEPSGN